MEKTIIFANDVNGKYDDGTYGSPFRSYLNKDSVVITVNDGLIKNIDIKPTNGEVSQEYINNLLVSQCGDLDYNLANADYSNRIYELLYGHFNSNNSVLSTPEINYNISEDDSTVNIYITNKEGADVYYSIDGSSPSTLYKNFLTLKVKDINSDKISVRAVAKANGYQSSDEKQAEIYINSENILNNIKFYQQGI